MSLHIPEGREALDLAMREADPGSLGAATRLRKAFAPEVAAAALGQAVLRSKARTKFGDRAESLFFTPDGLEQATRPVVSRWRAQRLVDAGITRVVDLGCGIGADSLACLDAGLEVVAVELDETTADHARANLPGARVIMGDAVALAPELLSGAGSETCVFIDPARRTEYGRTWDVAAFTPPWSFVLELLDAPHSSVVKLGPGVPRQLIPDDVEALWVADGADLVECSLWRLSGAAAARGAVLLDARHPDRAAQRVDHVASEALPVGPVGRFVLEPHPAAIRAQLSAQLAPHAWLLDEHIAYLCSDEALDSPWFACFEVLEVLDFNPKMLKQWVRENSIGTLEIKKRGIDLDPAELRKQLRLRGRAQATLLIAPTQDGARALVVRRPQ